MKIATIKICAERIKVQRDLPQRVRTINNRENARFSRTTDGLFDRKDQRGWGCDMADEYEARTGSDGLPKVLNKIFLCREWSSDLLIDISKTPFFRKKAPHSIHCSILVIRCKDLVIGTEFERAGNDIERDRRILCVNKIVCVSTQIFPKRGA